MHKPAWVLSVALAAASVQAAVPPPPAPPAPASAATVADPQMRAKVSGIVGYDIAQSLRAIRDEIDLAAVERAIRNSFDGKPALLDDAASQRVGQALLARIGARNGQPVQPGAPTATKEEGGLLVGLDLGRSLVPIKDEVDLPLVMAALRAELAGQPAAMPAAERDALRTRFMQQMRVKAEARARELSTRNLAEGAAFLAKNKQQKGVFTTPSGLQYMVLRQGAGPRPKPTDLVRVHYRGTLLDGTQFDSSYDRKEPTEFPLNQVIAGWTEGVSMMPVGGKYRFWVPAALGYGEKGAGAQIGPNATLVFDVELLSIAQ